MSRLLKLQWKRLIKAIPRLLIGAVIPVIFAGMTVFFTLKVGENGEAQKTKVALVNYDSENSLSFVLPYVMQADAAGAFLFEFMDEQHALSALSDGTVCAVLLFPKGMLSGILDSTNVPATLLLPENSSLPSILLSKFAEAGTKTLGSAQAGVYTACDLYREYGFYDHVSDITDRVNFKNLPYATSREKLFYLKMRAKTGELSLTSYYIATLFLLILLFLGSCCGDYLCNGSSKLLSRKLLLSGIPVLCQEAALFLPLFCFITGSTALLSFALSFILPEFSLSPAGLILLLILSLCMTLYTELLFRLFRQSGKGLLSHLFFGITMLFLGGGFLPFAFLPKFFQKISVLLPFGSCLVSFRKLLSGALTYADCLFPVLHCLLLGLFVILIPLLQTKEVHGLHE